MVSGSTIEVTFLPWTADGHKDESQKRLLSTRRHQHTALAGHRKNRDKQKKLHAGLYSSTTTPGYSAQVSEIGTDGSWALTRIAAPLSRSESCQEIERIPSPNDVSRLKLFGLFNASDDVKLPGEFRRTLHDGTIIPARMTFADRDSLDSSVACVRPGYQRECNHEGSPVSFSYCNRLAACSLCYDLRGSLLSVVLLGHRLRA